MIYREYLVMRKAVLVFLAIIAAITLLFTVVAATQGKYHSDAMSGFVGAAWFTGCFASIFGVALGSGSRDGARVFWTLPTPRWRSALEVVVADIVAIIIAALGVAVLTIAISAASALLAGHGNSFAWNFSWIPVLAAIMLPLAIYGWSAVVGMVGRRVPYISVVVMPMLMVWFGLSQVGGVVGDVLRAPLAINPVFVYAFPSAAHHHGLGEYSGFAWITPDVSLLLMMAIALAGCIAAIALWSRAEVLA